MKQTARYLIVFGCLYPSCCKGSSYQNIKKESYDLSSLTLCFVWYSNDMCFFAQPVVASSILFCLHLDRRKKKKTDNNHTKR